MKNSLLSVMLGAVLLIFALLSPAGASAQSVRQPAAPLPDAVTSAKTIFVASQGGNSVAYDAFCEGMRDWGKYEIVASADEADLIVELSYVQPDKGATPSGENALVSTQSREQRNDSKVMVTFYDSRTNEALWSASEPQKRAKREKNREREAIESVQHLVSDLKLGAAAAE